MNGASLSEVVRRALEARAQALVRCGRAGGGHFAVHDAKHQAFGIAAGRAAGTGGFSTGAGVARFGFAGDALAFLGAAFFGAGISMPGMLSIEWSCAHAGTDRPKVAAVINAVRSVLMPRLPWDGH